MSYSKNTIRRAEQILGYGITDGTGTRTFTVIDGIIYTDIFEGVPVIDGLDDYRVTFNGHANPDYSNQIHINCRDGQQVEVTADWGSCSILDEIDELLSWLEANGGMSAVETSNVQSKKIEDFTVSYKSTEEAQASRDASILAVWSYYIRQPLIIGISSEKHDAARYF